MLTKLSAKHEAFVKLMVESDELARRGFDLLLKRDKPDEFFDALQEAGLFEASKNPAPVAAEHEGYVRIPYWVPLDYLVAAAKISGERNDVALAEKIMAIVRAVSSQRDANGRPVENYHTNRKFAEILGLVPTQVVTLHDVGMIGVWLQDPFEKGMIGHALDGRALPRFINSSSQDDWDKAVEIVRHCTVVRWQAEKDAGEKTRKPVTAVDDYWLKELLNHHLAALAAKRGPKLAALFLDRVREVFSAEGRREYAHIYRPAVEEHSQNHDWHGAENRSVEGLRDSLIGWCGTGDASAVTFVQGMLGDDFVIVRRIAIFTVCKCWTLLSPLFEAVLGPKLFDLDHLHELYNLLNEHFAQLDPALRERTVEVIGQIEEPDWSDEPARALKSIQLRWLSAISEKGSAAANSWFDALKAELGSAPEHPDFLSYSEVRVGPGPSPYSVQDLLAFLQNGTLIDKLNSFESTASWSGPTVEGLVSTTEEAVKSAPALFLRRLPDLLKLKTAYQHAALRALKDAWDSPSDRAITAAEPDWDRAWPDLVSFFEALITPIEFWEQPIGSAAPMVPTRNWMVSTIAEFLQSGTRKDEHAYPATLFPRTRALVQILLDKASPVEEPSDDAMTQAINSNRGKAIEALISQALRECRVADQNKSSHEDVWARFKTTFDGELDKCKDSNFEFSTLAAAYIAQFRYMDAAWVERNIPGLFPEQFRRNSACALDGLAYSSFSRETYRQLTRHAVTDRVLRYDLKGRVAREKLLERIAVAYLWKEDELDSNRFEYLFRPDGGDDLVTMTHVFWSVRSGDLADEQRERVLAFWDRCIRWSQEGGVNSGKVLSTLSTLVPYLKSATGKERELLEAVAPHVHIGYNAHNFVEDLSRLVEDSPDGVSAVIEKVIAARLPDYDYKDQLKLLLERLAEKGKREDVIRYAERLRNLAGVQELYDRLRANA